MVEIDSRSKGIILNCTLKFYKITPIESSNVLRVTMMFYGGFKYKSPSKRRRDNLRKENSWPSLGEILFWYQYPSWSLANPHPLLSWVDQFLKAWPLPLLQRWRRWWQKSRDCIRSVSAWPRRQRKGTEV